MLSKVLGAAVAAPGIALSAGCGSHRDEAPVHAPERVPINGTFQLRTESAGKINDIKAVQTGFHVRRNGRWPLTARESTRVPRRAI
ncbi:MAG TPA: hypothetical protein VGO53_13620 [Steroidobacteraceae bacterium]|jgi:hypothetical protein|nr:hypothetical protein [Steroidobacteraceae bacterium]